MTNKWVEGGDVKLKENWVSKDMYLLVTIATCCGKCRPFDMLSKLLKRKLGEEEVFELQQR